MRAFRLILLALAVLLGGFWAWAWATRVPGQGLAEAVTARLGAIGLAGGAGAGGGIALPSGISLGGPFVLLDETGQRVTEADFAGSWLLLYFGYTYCPDVCPTELGTLAAAVDLMGEAARVVPVLITIDPERDTPAQLADYVSRFHPRLRGLTGTVEQVTAMTRSYRVYFAKSAANVTTEYLMDHSSFVYLVGPDARVRALYRPQMTPEDMAEAVTRRIRAG